MRPADRPKGARGSPLLRVLQRAEVTPVRTDRKPCPGLWKTPVIRWDGQLMACCADVDGEIPLGNLGEHDFDALWFGERMTQYRLLHIEGRFDEMPKCGDCGGIHFYKLDPDEVQQWLAEVGRLDLWPAYQRRIGLSPA